ncbi:TIGR01440 family protein [Cohnella sp. GCM10027633]|uniref:TIGR01440 family protein n=1 Tax=unclassified Cohnella TaxID=2636738 RepID=UPI00362501C4
MTSEAANDITERVEQVLSELAQTAALRPGRIVVLGVSTSEVRGERIGTSGALSIAEQIHDGVERVRRQYGFDVVWQCCEHLNRALVTERSVAEARGWIEVSAVPVPKAGGSMAAYAYRQLREPCLVESVQAHAGVDIGETMIGMHLRPVAVPLRPSVRWIGQARVTMATTRPRLIGGARAVYALDEAPRAAEGEVAPGNEGTACD